MTNNKPHVHADMIIEWARTGKKVQAYACEEWVDTDAPHWLPGRKYRFKPETKRYRVAFMSGERTSTVDNEEQERAFEKLGNFVRWLTDWVEYEV